MPNWLLDIALLIEASDTRKEGRLPMMSISRAVGHEQFQSSGSQITCSKSPLLPRFYWW